MGLVAALLVGIGAPAAKAGISGRVVGPSGVPLREVVVSLEKGGLKCKSDADGGFALESAAITDDVVVASKAGYLEERQWVGGSNLVVNLKMIECADTATDIDGNVYRAVRLGNQVWTVTNLRTKRFNDGTPIPLDSATGAWKDNTSPLYCHPKDISDPRVLSRFGLLYNFYAVETGKLAPKGWHVPTSKEWAEFEAYLIGQGFNWDGSKSGDEIAKAISAKTDWNVSTIEGTIGCDLIKNNATGFAAYGTGFRHESGIFDAPGRYTGWWTSTPASSDHAAMIDLHFNQAAWSNAHHYRSACGYPVRLIKD